MSAEGRKKRGAAGASHGKACPFRGNGRPPDWMARKIGATYAPPAASGGSTTIRGVLGGVLASKLGFPMVGDFERLLAHAETRVTHPLLKVGVEQEAIEDAQQDVIAEAA